ncbi:hypothetical protein PORY_000174 [Pneumocystis oryctolagi]|uniref:Uncharacterized protein n=1 Tax=Pneumocystis oryctolagi TaxID=42067 RepID=A0ACB7CET5_9ASCO|nr:hypothetical protein PORY_000174 [Pneumocystis oryctolagi]
MDEKRKPESFSGENVHDLRLRKRTRNSRNIEDILEEGQRLVKAVQEAKDSTGRLISENFVRLPSKKLYPDYYELIKKPIALDMIKEKLKKGDYVSMEDIREDFLQMCNNAKRYNVTESQIYQDAQQIGRIIKSWGDEMSSFNKAEETKKLKIVHRGSQKNVSEMAQEILLELKAMKDPWFIFYISKKNADIFSGRTYSDIFLEIPNRKEYPEYYQIIQRPMSFNIVEKKIKKDQYSRLLDFENDIKLIFMNAMVFNEDGSQISNDAKTLLKFFQKKMSKKKESLDQSEDSEQSPLRVKLNVSQSSAPKIRLSIGSKPITTTDASETPKSIIRLPISPQTKGSIKTEETESSVANSKVIASSQPVRSVPLAPIPKLVAAPIPSAAPQSPIPPKYTPQEIVSITSSPSRPSRSTIDPSWKWEEAKDGSDPLILLITLHTPPFLDISSPYQIQLPPLSYPFKVSTIILPATYHTLFVTPTLSPLLLSRPYSFTLSINGLKIAPNISSNTLLSRRSDSSFPKNTYEVKLGKGVNAIECVLTIPSKVGSRNSSSEFSEKELIASPLTSTQQQTLSSSETASLEKCGLHNQSMTLLDGCFEKNSFLHGSDFTKNMVHTYIVNALETQDQNHGMSYEDLRKQFSCNPKSEGAPSSIQLRLLLFSLIHVVSKLDLSRQDLVKDILKMYWVGRDNEFVSVYIQFLGTVASAYSSYIPLIVQMLVRLIASDPHSIESLPNETPITPDLICDRVHFALKYILDLVPVSYTFLFSMLVTEFPHKSQKTSLQVTYLKNLLRILEYAPVISGQVFGLIIDKIIQIDVEIQIELEDLDEEADEVAAAIEDDANSKDKLLSLDDCSNADAENDDIEESLDPSQDQLYIQAVVYIRDMVDRLDCMLTVLFDYLATIFTQSEESKYKSESLMDLTFKHLLHAFDSIILHTFRSRYTQFILFWVSQTNEKYMNMFLGLILERTLDISRSPVSRSISCAYVASFVARALGLNKDMIRNTVNTLCRWMNLFLDEWENVEDSSDVLVKKFNTFYSIVQSVLYIFCFRWRDLTDEDVQENSSGWLKSLFVLQRAIASRLNPLRYCSSNIVSQFASLAHQLNFLYCYPMIEQNKRLVGVHSFEGMTEAFSVGEVEDYFPFDPCALKRSRRWIDPIYNEWVHTTSLDEACHSDENTD